MPAGKKPNKAATHKKQVKKSKKVSKGLKVARVKPVRLKKLLVYGTVLVVVLLASVFFAYISTKDSKTATVSRSLANSSVQLETASGMVTQGQTFRVKIYTDSSDTSVNAVQATVLYPSSILKLDQVDASRSDYPIDAYQSNQDGSIQIVRGVIGGVTDKKLISELEFTAIASGMADLAIDKSTTTVVDSVYNKDTLNSNSIKNISIEVQ